MNIDFLCLKWYNENHMERFGSAPQCTTPTGVSLRTIFTFFFAVIVTVFLWATLVSQPAHAQDASWNGNDAIIHAGMRYSAVPLDELAGNHGIPSGSTVFIYREEASAANRKAFVIYFSPGIDPPTATSATAVEFSLKGSNELSKPQNSKTVSLTPQGQEEPLSSCSVGGVGWVICPISVFLAEGMDKIFDILSGLIQVQPLLISDTNNDLYRAWSIMRTIANVAFVIAFLIIIYSQVTSMGVSNYGLKRLIPRLIVAAILVNISYYIAAIGIDLSNVLGFSVQNLFTTIRTDVFNITNDTFGGSVNWGTVVAIVLGGAGLTYWSVGSAGGALYLLLPLLVGLILLILFVVLVLAARQAIIIILVVIAPLAFVANLLPNTEGWFKKWQQLFMTMLIFFPAFSLVFGGSQLAGQIIVQNAGDNIIIVIFGLAVQVAPLIITPLLLKLSGSLLGRIAQMVNDPRKGFMDRTRNWSKERQEMLRQKNLSKPVSKNPLTYGRAALQWADNKNRHVKDKTELYKKRSDNRYHNSKGYKNLHEQTAGADLQRQATDERNEAHIEALKATPGSELQQLNRALATDKQSHEAAKVRANVDVERLRVTEHSDLHTNTLNAKAAEATLDTLTSQNARMMEEYKSGKLVPTGEKYTFMSELKQSSINAGAEKQGVASAQYEVQRAFAEAMNAESIAGESLRKIAASVNGIVGETRARAQAVSSINKLDDDALKSNMELLKANATQARTTIKAYSQDIVNGIINGTLTDINDDQLRAALQLQAEEKNMSLFEAARGSLNINQDIVSEVIADNVGNFKVAGGFHLQADPSLNVRDRGASFMGDLAKARVATLGNVGADNLSSLKAGWLVDFTANLDDNLRAARDSGDYRSLQQAYMSVKRALTTPDILAKLNDREDEVRRIEKALAEIFNEAATEDPRPTI